MFVCRYKHSVKHFPVSLTEKGVELGSHQVFPNVETFVKHFLTNPLFGDESGTCKMHTQYCFPSRPCNYDCHYSNHTISKTGLLNVAYKYLPCILPYVVGMVLSKLFRCDVFALTIPYTGSFIQCLHPYPRSVEECDVYDVVTCHFLYGRGVGSDDESGDSASSSVGLSVYLIW